jgi:hypothetical protein
MGINVPDRNDDSAEEFVKQQAELAKQIHGAKEAALEAELQKILDEESK